jgi:hypothetical protein
MSMLSLSAVEAPGFDLFDGDDEHTWTKDKTGNKHLLTPNKKFYHHNN